MMSSVCVGGHLCIGLWSAEGNVCALSLYVHIYTHTYYMFQYIIFIYKKRVRADEEQKVRGLSLWFILPLFTQSLFRKWILSFCSCSKCQFIDGLNVSSWCCLYV